MSEVGIPTAYEEGYAKASAIDPDLARAYIELTTVGDPVADAAIDSLGEMDQGDANRFIRAGIHEDAEVLARAPETLQRFFRGIEGTPNWFDPAATRPGCQAFHSHSDLFIPAFFCRHPQECIQPDSQGVLCDGTGGKWLWSTPDPTEHPSFH